MKPIPLRPTGWHPDTNDDAFTKPLAPFMDRLRAAVVAGVGAYCVDGEFFQTSRERLHQFMLNRRVKTALRFDLNRDATTKGGAFVVVAQSTPPVEIRFARVVIEDGLLNIKSR